TLSITPNLSDRCTEPLDQISEQSVGCVRPCFRLRRAWTPLQKQREVVTLQRKIHILRQLPGGSQSSQRIERRCHYTDHSPEGVEDWRTTTAWLNRHRQLQLARITPQTLKCADKTRCNFVI